jgi:checkpoint serine/threonine-protein kinase
VVVNPRTGRAEQVFVDFEAVYPPGGDEEFSFEELRAISRGWTAKNWRPAKRSSPLKPSTGNAAYRSPSRLKVQTSQEPEDIENLTQAFEQKADLNRDTNSSFSACDASSQSIVGMPESQGQMQPPKQKKLKIREVKQETQTVKTQLESPTGGRKLKRKNSGAEPTMTFHSKAATNDIYDMFNQPLSKADISMGENETQSGDDFTDDGYSTAGESTGTGKISAPSSEFGDETLASIRRGHHLPSQNDTQSESVSPWSDFTASKHVPDVPRVKNKDSTLRKSQRTLSEDPTENVGSSSQNNTRNSGLRGAFDTLAIADIAGGQFDDMDTKAIALLAGDVEVVDEVDVTVDAGLAEAPVAASVEEVAVGPGRNSAYPQSLAVDEVLTTSVDQVFEIQHKPTFVPLPPVDYEPTPARPYRDPDVLAQNKLPFMTPIAERTESSFAPSTVPGYFDSKTPSRPEYKSPSKAGLESLALSSAPGTPSQSPAKRKHHDIDAVSLDDDLKIESPFKKISSMSLSTSPVDPPLFAIFEDKSESDRDEVVFKRPALPAKTRTESAERSPLKPLAVAEVIHKGPVIADLQCNPCDDNIRQQILAAQSPSLSSWKGFYDNSDVLSNRYHSLKSYAEKQSKEKKKGSPRKSSANLTQAVPLQLRLQGTRVYSVKRMLGEGAFAPVYLVEGHDPSEYDDEVAQSDLENKPPPFDTITTRQPLEALKSEALGAESSTGTLPWEFHILRTIKTRLGTSSRTMQSIILAQECHLYRDESFLILSYSPQGTLLDLVNCARSEAIKAGKNPEGIDETVAMFLTVELLRLLESLHSIGILHGDLKPDNCLVRFSSNVELTGPYDPQGGNGWSSKGLTLIDFGRGIDTTRFQPAAQFIADWDSCTQDCAEIREARPWKHQIDYHGTSGIIHSLLFGKYIETIPANGTGGLGQRKEWKLKESFKRYWEKEIWNECFTTLLNPGTVGNGECMPVQGNLRRVRMRMEKFLVEEGEKSGRNLRNSLAKLQRMVPASS